MDKFFIYENQLDDRSSIYTILYQGTKAALIDYILKPGRNGTTKNVTVMLFDMAAVVHMEPQGSFISYHL